MRQERINKLKPIINACGEKAQIIQAIEELSELQKALCKYLKAAMIENKENITEEMADVQIMIDQLKVIFNNDDDVQKVEVKKIERTYKRLDIENHKEKQKMICLLERGNKEKDIIQML